eukprot:4883626-Amphidinium_carterae.3
MEVMHRCMHTQSWMTIPSSSGNSSSSKLWAVAVDATISNRLSWSNYQYLASQSDFKCYTSCTASQSLWHVMRTGYDDGSSFIDDDLRKVLEAELDMSHDVESKVISAGLRQQ